MDEPRDNAAWGRRGWGHHWEVKGPTGTDPRPQLMHTGRLPPCPGIGASPGCSVYCGTQGLPDRRNTRENQPACCKNPEIATQGAAIELAPQTRPVWDMRPTQAAGCGTWGCPITAPTHLGNGPRAGRCSRFLLLRNRSTKSATTGNSAERGRTKRLQHGLPADGHRERLRGTGAGTDHLRPQPSGLEDVEERVTGGYGPCVRQSGRKS